MKVQDSLADRWKPEVWFDFDGTLVDSAPGVMQSLQNAFERCGLEPPPITVTNVVGPPLADVIDALTPGESCETRRNIADAFRLLYDTHGCESTLPFVGVADLLEKLFAEGMRLRVLTNKRQRPLEQIVRYLGWTKFFVCLHGIDEGPLDGITTTKPERAAVIDASRKSEQIYVVGDGLDDLHTAERIGAKFLLAGWGYSTGRVLTEQPEVTVLHQPSDLLPLVRAEQ